ncbi:AraC family transcriptional regulator [Reichenbachiella sp. MALMAid0571]|uniref:AraC family transcriptional regulator n=1 Tax=Reichenbachiella sp. MALMAid0571 TaxID=3143939 RepID=UPI0032DFE1F3
MQPIYEKIPLSIESSIRIFLFDKPEFDGHWHFHPECELTCILESTGIRYVGNHIADFQKGDLVLLGSNLPHCWKNINGFKGVARCLVLQWDQSIIGKSVEFEAINKMIDQACRGLKFDTGTTIQIESMMLEMLNTSPINRYVLLIKLLDKLTRKKEVVMLAGDSYFCDLSNQTEDRLKRVQTHVKDNYNKRIRLSDIATVTNMNEQAFSRFFSKTMQKPFFVFLNEYRVNVASRLLLETDKQVAEIGFYCGYETLPFFYKQFKKFKGYSPLGFRKMYSEKLLINHTSCQNEK